MPTSVGDSGDSARGIVDLWVGDGNDNARHAVHAWIGDENGNARPVDVPTVCEVENTSQCLGSGEFRTPSYSATVSWANLHFGNVTHVEIFRNGFEYDTVAVGASGSRQSYSDGDLGEIPIDQDVDYSVRYQYDDGSHSQESNEDTIFHNNPCN